MYEIIKLALIPIVVIGACFPNKRLNLITLFLCLLIPLEKVVQNILFPKEWDFLCFYLIGKAVHAGLNVYDPSTYFELLNSLEIPINVTQDFYDEFVKAGTRYPPQSLFIFYPLGFFPFFEANLVWNIILLGSLILAVYLLYKWMPSKWTPLFCLLIVLPASTHTLSNSQLNFFVLSFLLLFILTLKTVWSGPNLFLASLFKPYVLLISIYFFLKKRLIPLLALLSVMLISLILALLALGSEPLETYFSGSFTQHLKTIYLDGASQSLLSLYYKSVNLYGENVFIAMGFAGVLTFIIILTGLAINKVFNNDLLIISLLLMASLLIFPTINNHYSVTLIIPIAILTQEFGLKKLMIPLLILYFCLFYSSFLGTFLLWIAMVCLSLRYFSKETHVET